MHENLILLGAGATSAISDDCLPTAGNFFTSNAEWSDHKNDFPHLALAYKKVEHLKNESSDNRPVNLTDVWLFIDTLYKYHVAMATIDRNNKNYNSGLLRLRYKEYGEALPYYLSPGYLNNHYNELCFDMHPLFSTLDKQIYSTFTSSDPVNYFLILAGWELKYLNYKTYGIDKKTNGLYKKLIGELKSKNASVISFNWDIYFEKACKAEGRSIQLVLNGNDKHDNNIIYLCKPHGGWNIQHVDNLVLPYPTLSDSIEDRLFDRVEAGEVRPAMIPYFSGPDEISALHGFVFPHVGEFFKAQQEVMKKMFNAAKNMVSIGYSFSEDDRHVLDLITPLAGRNKKRLLCILKDKDEKNKERIGKTWNYDSVDNFQYDGSGFRGESIKSIVSFLNGE